MAKLSAYARRAAFDEYRSLDRIGVRLPSFDEWLKEALADAAREKANQDAAA